MPVLFFQQDQISRGIHERIAPGIVQPHKRPKAKALRLVRQARLTILCQEHGQSEKERAFRFRNALG
jgi:hypothetical protein